MVYPRYYARRFGTQTGWRRPASGWGARRQNYGYRPGYGVAGQSGYRTGNRGTGLWGNRYGAGRTWPRYGAAFSQYRRNWPWRAGRGFGYSPQPYGAQAYGAPSYGAQPYGGQTYGSPQSSGGETPRPSVTQWIAWAQSCLAQVVGSWVPQNGTMGKATRHAIRQFQKQQQMPATGALDAATVTALQAACSGQGAGGQAGAAPPSPPAAAPASPAGDDVAAASAAAAGGAPQDAPPPNAGAGAPDGGAPSDASGGPPPDAPSGELFMRGGRRRFRNRWAGLFSPQPPDGGDEGEYTRRGRHRRRRFRNRWAGLAAPQQPDSDDGDGGSEFFMGEGRDLFGRGW